MTNKVSIGLLFSVLLGMLFGCDSDSSIPKTGNYEGTLIVFTPGNTSTPLQKFAVSAELTRPNPEAIHLEMKGNPSLNTVTSSLDIALNSDGQKVNLTIPGAAILNQTLAVDGHCFSSQAPMNIRMCNRQESIVISAQSATNEPIYSLSLEYFGNVASDIQLETPQTFTLDAAVAQAMTKDFDTQVEFQHMLQARLVAKTAYLDLMPHLSNSSIFTLTTGGPLSVIGVLGMAGDLVPFLFPSRWLAVKESGQLSNAESDALALMRGDAGLNVEILAYAIDHDNQELAFLEKDFSDALAIHAETVKLEAQNLVPAGTSKHLESILASLHDAMDDLTYPMQAEYAAISQAMGFVNPLAVTAVQIPSTAPALLNGQEVLNIADFQTLVLGRSIELRQMNHLVDAANTSKSADYFNWLDPSADISQSLGFGLGSTIKIDQSQIVSLQIQKTQTASTVLQNLADAIIQYNHSVDDMADSVNGMKLEQGRKDKLMAALSSGQPVSDTEITSIPFDQLTWQINSLDAQLDYRSSMAKINRMLLQGYYANLDGTLTQPKK